MPRRDLRPISRGDYFTDGYQLVEILTPLTSKGDVVAVDAVSDEILCTTVQNFRASFRRVIPKAA